MNPTDQQILRTSAVAKCTLEKERAPLTRLDALVILLRSHRFLIDAFGTDSMEELYSKLDADRDFIRFHADITREVFGA
jgi:hypothetical protein